MDDMNAIETSSLTRRFGSLCAVDALSLEIPRGVVFGFLGPNGSGKTTTIRLLLGLLAPSGGTARVLGVDVARDPDAVRSRAGALLEYTGLYERLSAEANLDYHARIARMPSADRTSRIRELLSQTGLWTRRHEPISAWSRGMKQKLAVARALLARPPLVFLDEPTAGLDPLAAAALREDLATLVRRDGTTVFLTTHNLTEAERLCHLVAVVRRGKLLACGTPADLRQRAGGDPQVIIAGRGMDERVAGLLRRRADVSSVECSGSELAVSLRGEADVAAVVADAVGAGAAVEEVRRRTSSLEDLFLDLVEDRAGVQGPTAEGREAATC
jgi:ABC-2 type transport system ATP-binding protein